jgi:hypothetical protein
MHSPNCSPGMEVTSALCSLFTSCSPGVVGQCQQSTLVVQRFKGRGKGAPRDLQDSSTIRAVQQPTFLKVQLRKISEFVAAIGIVLTDDPTISTCRGPRG